MLPVSCQDNLAKCSGFCSIDIPFEGEGVGGSKCTLCHLVFMGLVISSGTYWTQFNNLDFMFRKEKSIANKKCGKIAYLENGR